MAGAINISFCLRFGKTRFYFGHACAAPTSKERRHAHAGNRGKTRRRYRRDLMPPGIGQFRPAVAGHHQRTFALFEQEYSSPLAEMVGEDCIAFPPCFRDFVGRSTIWHLRGTRQGISGLAKTPPSWDRPGDGPKTCVVPDTSYC